MDRDLPLNKQQRNEGCIMLIIMFILFITVIYFLNQSVKNYETNRQNSTKRN
jgi:preprotein translocase subunit YajC